MFISLRHLAYTISNLVLATLLQTSSNRKRQTLELNLDPRGPVDLRALEPANLLRPFFVIYFLVEQMPNLAIFSLNLQHNRPRSRHWTVGEEDHPTCLFHVGAPYSPPHHDAWNTFARTPNDFTQNHLIFLILFEQNSGKPQHTFGIVNSKTLAVKRLFGYPPCHLWQKTPQQPNARVPQDNRGPGLLQKPCATHRRGGEDQQWGPQQHAEENHRPY